VAFGFITCFSIWEIKKMITRRQFSKIGLGLAAFSQTTHQIFSQIGGGDDFGGPVPKEGADIRRVGVRVNGEYWGLMDEKIDMLSGNLNYSFPLFQAGGQRGLFNSERAVSTNVVCSYNSQVWKKDGQHSYFYGADLSCGFGWWVQIGVIVPKLSGDKINGYVFIDSTGAEYLLTPSSTTRNDWVCLQGEFISYDPEAVCLKFPNGNFWIMGCESAAGEPDAGALYPTMIQDTNGNRILIGYMQGAGSAKPNSSSRMQEIEDIQAVETPAGRRTYSFIYSKDEYPHLMAIASHIDKGNSYRFSYAIQQLCSPFGNSDLGAVSTLVGIEVSPGMKFSFAYNEYGELTESIIPSGGYFRWGYNTVSFAQGRKIREVVRRSIAFSPQDAGSMYSISRDTNMNALIHESAILQEPNNSTNRIWSFCTDASSPYFGLAISFEDRGEKEQPSLQRIDYTWNRTKSGTPYRSCIAMTLDPGSVEAACSKTEFVRDLFGNLTEQRQYDYNEANTPYKITRHTYLAEPAYLSRNIFNRLVSTSVSEGEETTEVVKYKYDTTPLEDNTNVLEHDTENCGTANSIRGNRTEVIKNGVLENRNYFDVTGNRTSLEYRSGNIVKFPVRGNTNSIERKPIVLNSSLSLGSQVRLDSNVSHEKYDALIASLNWGGYNNTIKLLNSLFASKDYFDSISHDVNARTVTFSSKEREKKVTYDGFLRTVSIERKKEGETISITEYEYDSNATAGKPKHLEQRVQWGGSSTFFKTKRKTLPHALNSTPEWVEYDYDSLGRNTRKGNNRYVYKGNSVLIIDAVGG
jgi:hypothetical protein